MEFPLYNNENRMAKRMEEQKRASQHSGVA